MEQFDGLDYFYTYSFYLEINTINYLNLNNNYSFQSPVANFSEYLFAKTTGNTVIL